LAALPDERYDPSKEVVSLRRFSCLLVLVPSLVALIASVSFGTVTCEWLYTGDDNEDAAVQLGYFLQDHGANIYSQGQGYVVVRETFKIILSPKMSEDGLDRIVVHVLFGVKGIYKGSHSFLRFINDLNSSYNAGAFYMNDDGDMVFTTQFTFLNHFTWDEISAFIRWVDKALQAIISANKYEFSKYLE